MPVNTVTPAADTIATNDTAANTNGKIAKFIALGDSYTIGQSVDESERFPSQIVKMLKAENVFVSEPEYIATTGWTTANLMSAIRLKNPAKNFDIVTLLIGVNDQYQQKDTTGYRTRFAELLREAVAIAGNRKNHVVVLSIPDYSVTPFVSESDKLRVSAQIDEFNAINKEVTLQNSITYIDITTSTRNAAEDPSLIANDGLHPSGKEYTVWATLAVPVIKKILQ